MGTSETAMTPEQWERVDSLFHSALKLERDRRPAFVAEACAGDDAVRREVESLLHWHEDSEDFIETPASDVAAALLQRRYEWTPGQRVGRYEIASRLGSGGMGEVYLAHDTLLDRQIALKRLPAQFTGDADRVRRFEREARAASTLNHPNIVTVHEIGREGSSQFLATEFIDGETLRQRTAREPMKLEEALAVAAQIASALAAAHAAGVVHRDIKPENVMLRRDRIAKVLDFGLAKPPARTYADSIANLTIPGLIMGTARYMSPEQVRGHDVDHRTDIWSLGVLLYELVAGRVPFDGETPSDVIVSILERELTPLTRYTAVPRKLERMIAKALQKDRDKRYSTADEMGDDLRDLIREMEIEAHTGRSSRDEKPPAIASGRKYRRAWTLSLATFALLAVLAVTGYFRYARARGEAIDSVAVLPFANVDRDPNTEHLVEGISDGIINSLSRLPNLKVISLNSVVRYKERPVDPRSVGNELKVRAVLMGRLMRRGDQLTISTELVDARDDRRLWGHRYERKLADILGVQDQIAADIAERLRRPLSGEDRRQLAKYHTDNSDAYELYLKARYLFDRRTRGGVKQSIEYLQQAIGKDPNYALAHAGLANSLTPSDLVLPPRATMVQAKAAAKRALELDDTLAEAHTAQARVLLFYDWNGPAAEAELKRAIELNPKYAEAHHMHSHYLMSLGQIEPSIAAAERALRIDPLDILLNVHMGWTLLYARRYGDAIEQLRKTVALDPGFFQSQHLLGRAYALNGSYGEALVAYRKAMDLEGGGYDTLVSLGHLYAAWGKRTEANAALGQVKKLYQQKTVSAYDVAVIYASLGETDPAIEWLEKAFDERTGGLLLLRAEPLLDPLRTDPRFVALVEKVDLSS
jgi:serine/threonine protein kinase/tetratricopeptide (TPR) repeat protein